MDTFGEISFSADFYIHKDFFSESLYTQSDFSCERRFLPPGVKQGQKGGQNWSFPIKW